MFRFINTIRKKHGSCVTHPRQSRHEVLKGKNMITYFRHTINLGEHMSAVFRTFTKVNNRWIPLIEKYVGVGPFLLQNFKFDLKVLLGHEPYVRCHARRNRANFEMSFISYIEFCYDNQSFLQDCAPNHNFHRCPETVSLANVQDYFTNREIIEAYRVLDRQAPPERLLPHPDQLQPQHVPERPVERVQGLEPLYEEEEDEEE